MAHKTLIGGTAYEISGGKTLIGGTAYSIKGGKTLVDGTAYSLSFLPVITLTGSAADTSTGGYAKCTINGSTYNAALSSRKYSVPKGTVITCEVRKPGMQSGPAKISVNGTVVAQTSSSMMGVETATYEYVVKGNASIHCKVNGFGTIEITEK